MLASHLMHALRQLHLPCVEFVRSLSYKPCLIEQMYEDCIGNTEHSIQRRTVTAIVDNFCTLSNPNGVQSGPGNSVQTAYTDFDCKSTIVG